MQNAHKGEADPAISQLAKFVLQTAPNDILECTRQRVALLLLDTLGICAASAPMEAGRIGREAALALYGAGEDRYSARMLFDGRKVSLAGAAFAGATQTDNLDAHDGFNPVKGHIGVAVVPALAALAEGIPDLTGPEALTALVIGYEVAARAGLSLHASVSDYHTSGAWNALGVAAMAVRLRGHGAEVLRQALGIAEYHGPRSQMMREIANPTMLHDGSGMGALTGLSAAILAENGFAGAPSITVEAPEAAPFWGNLGAVWHTDQQYLKPYPICRWAHAPIDAARELCADHGIQAPDITRIDIRSFRYATELFPGMPDTTSQAQYSLPFAVASMIVHRQIGVGQIAGCGLRDPAVARLVALTHSTPDPHHEALFPNARSADVDITLTDGRVLRSGHVDARGGPERPYSSDDIIAKYRDFAGPVLGAARTDRLQHAILALIDGSSRFADVAPFLYDPVLDAK